jgi:hypothetical protein
MKHFLKTTFRQAAWAPAVVLIFYAIAAKGFNAYILYPWLDIPSHFCGGLAITHLFCTTIRNSQPLIGIIPKVIQLTLAVGLTAISAIVWEFIEYLSDFFLGSKLNLGVNDTLSDLFFGLLGAVFIVAFAFQAKRFGTANAGDKA